MKTIEINGQQEQWFTRADTFIVPAVGSNVTYHGPAFGKEGSRDMRLAKIKCRITAINAPTHDVSEPTVRLSSDIHGDAGCDVSCERLSETVRDEIAMRRMDEQLCAAWMAAHRAGHKDGTGQSFADAIAEYVAKPGMDLARIDRLVAGYVVSDNFSPYMPGTNPSQEIAMKAKGLL